MLECSGKVCYQTLDAVTGRLYRVGGMPRKSEGARILIWDGEGELADSLLDGAVGLVLTGCTSEAALYKGARTAQFCRLPSLAVSADLPDNTVAILDTAHKKLFVDPELETIHAYSGVSRRRDRRASLLLDGIPSPLPEGFEGAVVGKEMSADVTEEAAYELLCDISDRNTGVSLVAEADMSAGTESFIGRVRAIYRAGVWGRFSLLCRSVPTPDAARECVSLMHKVFRDLEKEGREFNGFMPKGLLIDTPIMLMSHTDMRMIDFFFLDVERLRYLLSGSADTNVGQKQTSEHIAAFMERTAPSTVSLRNAHTLRDHALRPLISSERLAHICTTPRNAERFERLE